jgi:peroxiredoxin
MVTTIRKLPATALAALFACVSLSGATSAGAPAAAPDFRLPVRAGGELALSSLRGQVVMINFWASWCGPCRQEFPALDQIYRKYKPMGFTLVGINVESEKTDAERFLGQQSVSFPILFDPDNQVSGQYGVRAMPTTVLVDRQGRLRWVHMAFKPGDEAKYVEQVRAALREQP